MNFTNIGPSSSRTTLRMLTTNFARSVVCDRLTQHFCVFPRRQREAWMYHDEWLSHTCGNIGFLSLNLFRIVIKEHVGQVLSRRSRACDSVPNESKLLEIYFCCPCYLVKHMRRRDIPSLRALRLYPTSRAGTRLISCAHKVRVTCYTNMSVFDRGCTSELGLT